MQRHGLFRRPPSLQVDRPIHPPRQPPPRHPARRSYCRQHHRRPPARTTPSPHPPARPSCRRTHVQPLTIDNRHQPHQLTAPVIDAGIDVALARASAGGAGWRRPRTAGLRGPATLHGCRRWTCAWCRRACAATFRSDRSVQRGIAGADRLRCSGSRRWPAAAVLTLPAIKLSFGSAAGAGLNDGSTRYCGRTNSLRRFAPRRRPHLHGLNSQYRPFAVLNAYDPGVRKQSLVHRCAVAYLVWSVGLAMWRLANPRLVSCLQREAA